MRANINDRPFDPDEMLLRTERLKAEGRLPSPEAFLAALQSALIEEKTERETRKVR